MPQNKALFYTVLLLMCISVFFNLVLFRYAKKYYIQANTLRLDPYEGFRFTTEKDRLDTSLPCIVMLGDSRAAGWKEFPVERVTFYNRGIYGQTSQQVLNRFDAHVVPLKPDLLVIQVGINDLKMIPFLPHQRNEIVTNCKKNLQALVNKTLDINAKVILTTIFPIGEVPIYRRFFWSASVEEAVHEVNEYLFTLQKDSVTVIDTQEILAPSGTISKEFSKDFIHLNTQGYRVLNNHVTPIIEGLLVRNH